MMLNRDLKGFICLLILVGFTLSLIIFVSLFYNSIEINVEDIQDDIIPEHDNIEFIDQIDNMICHMKIYFQLTKNRYKFSIIKSIDHIIEISSIILSKQNNIIPIKIQLKSNQIIIIKKNQWNNKIFHQGNYSISLNIHINTSTTTTTIKSNFIRQIWLSKYRILFTNNNYLFPYFLHSFYRSTFSINIISSDNIISNFPLNQINSLIDISQISFALLYQYECRSNDILQLCLPRNFLNDIDLFSYIFNSILNTNKIYENYFSKIFSLNKLIIITVLELNNKIDSKFGLIFIDQNILLKNIPFEEISQQYEFVYLIK